MLLSPERPPSPGMAPLVETWGGEVVGDVALVFVVPG